MKSKIFVVDPDPKFTALVSGFKPGRDAADVLPITFQWMSEADYDALVAEAIEQKLTGPDVVLRIVDDWGDEQIEMPIPYSREGVEQMAKLYPKFCNAVIQAYRREVKDAQAKN